MMNRVEMKDEMMAQVVGGSMRHRPNSPVIHNNGPKNETGVVVVGVGVIGAAGVEASENDDSFWGRLQKLL